MAVKIVAGPGWESFFFFVAFIEPFASVLVLLLFLRGI
jgi:hypothetical protein